MDKKALSPAVATVLLISLALVLALLIFLWASSFLGERVQKFEKPIEDSCENIVMQTEAYTDTDGIVKLDVANTGNVPISSLELLEKREGSKESLGTLSNGDLTSGSTTSFELSEYGLVSGDEIIVIPIITGKKGNQVTPHVCNDKYGQQLEVV